MKKKLAIILVLFLLAVNIAACSNSSNGENDNTSAATTTTEAATTTATQESKQTEKAMEIPKEPFDMVWMYNGGAGDARTIDFAKKVKELYNVDLEVQSIDKGVYESKLQVAFASGDIPDLCYIRGNKFAADVIDNDMAVPLTD